jgi:hypothetical protein
MELEKFNSFTNDIIFVDGLWGTGKSLLGPIISGMDRVEKVKIEHVYEYVAILSYLEKIAPDAVSWMLKTYGDLSQYNNLIGREVNLRWNDDSGLSINPNMFVYIKRLFKGEGDQKIVDINENNIALNVMSHMLMLVANPIFDIYGDRVKIIEMVRHPLYMVSHWSTYLERFNSPREFTVSFEHKGIKVPWFVAGWEDEYIKANSMDKVLICLIRLYAWLDESTDKAKISGHQLLTISFEALIMSPDKPLVELEFFLGRKHYPKLNSLLRKQKVPRKTISQGRGRAAYGWSNDGVKSEAQVYDQNLKLVKTNGTSEHISDFLKLIEKYNQKHPSILCAFH